MTVSLDQSYGRVEVSYLTGAGRAAGDLHFEIDSQVIQNDGGTDRLTSDIIARDLNLSGFQDITARIDVPFVVTTTGFPNSRSFSQLPFQPSRAYREQSGSNQTDISLPANLQPALLDARIRAFPGRSSVVPLRVSGQSFSVDSTGAGVFDLTTFQNLNYSNSGTAPDAINTVASRLSDFVRFPLADLPAGDRPGLRQSIATDPVADAGSYVYFSGDNVAISSAASGGAFEEISTDPTLISVGEWQNGSGDQGFQGTYDLRNNLPSDPLGVTQTVFSQYGDFRDYTQVLSGGSSFEIVMFPNSSERYTFEGSPTTGVVGREGDIVAIVRTGGKITAMYYGGVDLGAGTFTLLPIFYIGVSPTYGEDGNTDGVHPKVSDAIRTGTVSGYANSGGNATTDYASVRRFKFSFDSSKPLPAGASATGTATVFRI